MHNLHTGLVWLVIAAFAFVAVLAFHPGTASAQIACWCGGAACPLPDVADTKVDVRKDLDLGIYGDDDGPTNKPAAQAYLEGLAPVVVQVNDVQGAVKAINARALALGRKINVAILDHASPGAHDIGKETIGVKQPHRAKLDQFVSAPPVGAAGNIKNLNLLGCEPAQGINGLQFLGELKQRLRADEVKGHTSSTYNAEGDGNLYFLAGGAKAKVNNVGGIAELPEVAGTPLETDGSSGASAGMLAGAIAGAVLVGGVTLGGTAWYARRRWHNV